MSKHTQGPWRFERQPVYEEHAKLTGKPLAEHEGYFRDNNGDWIIVHDGGRIAAATFKGTAKRGQGYTAPDPEGQANGRLIAAAPDLLEALKAIVQCQGSSYSIRERDRALAAIAKAEGQ